MDSATEAIDLVLVRAKSRVGRTLRGKWHLDVLLGVGGMAAVYAATHRNGSRAAIKILHPEFTADTHIRARFFREGRIANTIEHGGAVKVLDEDEDDSGSVFLVMDLLDGESLDSRAARAGGRLPVDEVLATADQLLGVLIAAHEKGVIHRDLKPENVFLTRDGEVRVLDFGIARLRELTSQSNATRDGSMMGTPAYMPPEQARGLWDEVDARADLWAVGATMYALITGRPVHVGRTTNDVLVHAVTQPATPLCEAMQGVPEPVAALVDRALAFDKVDRWPDARSMQDALRHAFHTAHGTPISSHPRPTVPETVPNRTLASADNEYPPTLVSAGTDAAVASGRTGVPLRMAAVHGTRSLVLVAGGVAAAVSLAFAALLINVAASRNGAANNSGDPVAPPAVGAASATGAALAVGDGGRGAGDGATESAKGAVKGQPPASIVSVDDLPIATSRKGPVQRPPPVAKPSPVPPATSWKEIRK